jgi:D-alanine--poly(phosphoribitol) ligase subunit 1
MATVIMEAPAAGRRSLDAFFSESVRRFPDRPALVVRGRTWSYRALAAECHGIEIALQAAGLRQGQHKVGVVYAKGMTSYAAVLAIMCSDDVYVPLNPQAPADRLLLILEDAGVEGIVLDTSEALSVGVLGALRRHDPLDIFLAEEADSRISRLFAEELPQHRVWRVCEAGDPPVQTLEPPTTDLGDATTLAYILYTSGSTGVPKGVAVTQESACRCIEKIHQLFETCEHDRFTQFSALSFDVSIADLFLCWRSGGALCVPAPSEALVPLSFALQQQVTVWSSVPSLVNFLLKLKLLKSNVLPQLRLSLFAGEALPVELVQAWEIAAPGSRVFNVYGPTECTIFSTYHEYDSQSDGQHAVVPIGVPLPGLRCILVDEGKVIDEDDLSGELWLSGDQLALGYWNNPTATEAAFVSPPAGVRGEVWYRTGDLVSHRRGVGLVFRGRADRQVKLRGYRVELQEVESALRGVIGCVLVAVVPLRNAGGMCEQIIAYCDKLDADETTIKTRCAGRLPRYMVPDRIVNLETFPLIASGKIDYRALAALAGGQAGSQLE